MTDRGGVRLRTTALLTGCSSCPQSDSEQMGIEVAKKNSKMARMGSKLAVLFVHYIDTMRLMCRLWSGCGTWAC